MNLCLYYSIFLNACQYPDKYAKAPVNTEALIFAFCQHRLYASSSQMTVTSGCE